MNIRGKALSTIAHNFWLIFLASGLGCPRLAQFISMSYNVGGQEMLNDVPRRPFTLNRCPKYRLFFYFYENRFQQFISTRNLCLC